MGLVRTWTGQLARAAGASLIAPLVLLLASGVVASGGGLASFGSLREIASGPSMPDIGLAAPPGSALEDAEIVGADLSPPREVSRPAAPASDALASAGPVRAPVQTPDGGTVTPPDATEREPSGESFELNEPPTIPGGGVTAPTAPPPPAAPEVPAPVEDLLEVTRGLGDTLREPLEPLTNGILDLLRGPPRQ